MAGKRTFKPSDWNTGDSDGWATQKEFGRRELGERHPYASVYGPHWLFWLTHGYGWLKIGLPLFALWAIGHGGIPVVSDVVGWVFQGLWYLIATAAQEVWSYVADVVADVVVGVAGWLAKSVAWVLCTGLSLSVWTVAAVVLWREWGWLFEMKGVSRRVYCGIAMGAVLFVGLLIGVLA